MYAETPVFTAFKRHQLRKKMKFLKKNRPFRSEKSYNNISREMFYEFYDLVKEHQFVHAEIYYDTVDRTNSVLSPDELAYKSIDCDLLNQCCCKRDYKHFFKTDDFLDLQIEFDILDGRLKKHNPNFSLKTSINFFISPNIVEISKEHFQRVFKETKDERKAEIAVSDYHYAYEDATKYINVCSKEDICSDIFSFLDDFNECA